MFDMDICYKIIFESLFEEDVPAQITKKVHEYTGASVLYITISGKILAYAGEDESLSSSLARKYCTLSEFDQLRSCLGKEILYSEIFLEGRLFGYSAVFCREQSQREAYEKVTQLLSQAAEMFLKGKELEFHENIPMRKQIIARELFAEDKQNSEALASKIPGKYVMLLFPCQKEEKNKIFQEVQGYFGNCYFSFETNAVLALLYGIHEQNYKMLLGRIKESGRKACISEIFSNLSLCSNKKDLLVRMDFLNQYETAGGVLQEKDWYIQAIYTHTLPMFQEAGLADYAIQCLIEEDELKNTSLYETLKTYLLCENNLVDTAEELHIHRNTLVYRLKQIRKITERDINNQNVSREMLTFMMIYDVAKQAEDKQ